MLQRALLTAVPSSCAETADRAASQLPTHLVAGLAHTPAPLATPGVPGVLHSMAPATKLLLFSEVCEIGPKHRVESVDRNGSVGMQINLKFDLTC